MLFLSGRVVLDDGTTLTDSVAIQTTCRGTTHTVAYADRKGSFSVQLDSSPTSGLNGVGDMTDASTATPAQYGGTWRTRDWRDCQVRAALPGFTSQVVELSAHMSGDSRADIGNIALHRIDEVQGFTISATTAQAPPKARKDYEKGVSLEKKQNWTEAQEKFQSAVDLYSRYAVAWVELGRVQVLLLHNEDAKKSLQKALEADSHFLPAYQELAQIAAKEQRWKDLAEYTDQLLRLNPVNFPQYWLLNAAAYYYLHSPDAALKAALHGLQIDSQHRFPKLEYIAGLVLAEQHDNRGALEHLRNYVRLAPKAPDVEVAQSRISELEAQEAAAQQPQ